MNRKILFTTSALAIASSLASVLLSAAGKFSYEGNTFHHRRGCAGSFDTKPFMVLNEKVWIFSIGSSLVAGEVVSIVPMAKAKEILSGPNARETAFVDEKIECFRTLFADREGHAAIAKIKPAGDDSLGVVVRGLPANAWLLSGLGKPVSMTVKDNPYVESVRHIVTDTCYAPDSRVEVRKSPELNGRSIVQLVIGKAKKVSLEKRKQIIEKQSLEYETAHYKRFPEYKKERADEIEGTDFFESAGICRFFLDGKRVLKADSFSHVSGLNRDWGHEVLLDSRDWPYLRESSLGFISLDEGKNWDAVFIAYGMETTNFMIQSLDSASVTHYHGDAPSFR